ncbi:ferredoxin [Nocardia vermiculata]|uniref:Ferredoxin n=1 Tax=Nocardia vermiculata TaxID=257274 RepID=A0A846Y990_9NOCA|nr:ferredoxin [Nocardia vermiculata]NKY54402.1 ferredoxin [Nocardia vermiculata]
MKITVDRDACIGAGMCALTAPHLFDQDDNGTSLVTEPSQAPARHADAERAWLSCPAAAVLLDGRRAE